MAEFEGLTQQHLADRFGISLSGTESHRPGPVRVKIPNIVIRFMLLDCRFDFDRRGIVIGCERRSKDSCRECG